MHVSISRLYIRERREVFLVPEIINENFNNNRYTTILCAVYINIFPSVVHILPYDITCSLANPPLPIPSHDAVPALYTHEYTSLVKNHNGMFTCLVFLLLTTWTAFQHLMSLLEAEHWFQLDMFLGHPLLHIHV